MSVKSNATFALNILWTLSLFGGLAFGYGMTQGKISELESRHRSLEKRQESQEQYLNCMREDIKSILEKVSRMEGRLSGTRYRREE